MLVIFSYVKTIQMFEDKYHICTNPSLRQIVQVLQPFLLTVSRIFTIYPENMS